MNGIDPGARTLANMNRPKGATGAPAVTAVAQGATDIGLFGTASTNKGNIFHLADQAGAVDITVNDGLVKGQTMEVTQLKGSANAATLKDSAAATIATLTPSASISSSVKLMWTGATWGVVLYGAGAT